MSILVLFYLFADTITLNDTNTISIRSQINQASINNNILNLQKMNSSEINIYIYTNGGSVFEGLSLIEQILSLQDNGIKINCIAHKAISMGFIIFLSCNNRYILENGVLMHHDIQLSNINGELHQIQSEFQLLEKIKNKIRKRFLNISNINKYEYELKYLSNWWFYGDDALQYNLAQKIVRVLCNFKKKTIILPFENSIGTLTKHVFSSCPLVTNPIKDTEIEYNYSTDNSDITHIYKK